MSEPTEFNQGGHIPLPARVRLDARDLPLVRFTSEERERIVHRLRDAAAWYASAAGSP